MTYTAPRRKSPRALTNRRRVRRRLVTGREALERRVSGVRDWVVIGDDHGQAWVTQFTEVCASPPAQRRERSSDDIVIQYTAGATNAPKAVVWNHENILEMMAFSSSLPLRAALPDTVHEMLDINREPMDQGVVDDGEPSRNLDTRASARAAAPVSDLMVKLVRPARVREPPLLGSQGAPHQRIRLIKLLLTSGFFGPPKVLRSPAVRSPPPTGPGSTEFAPPRRSPLCGTLQSFPVAPPTPHWGSHRSEPSELGATVTP